MYTDWGLELPKVILEIIHDYYNIYGVEGYMIINMKKEKEMFRIKDKINIIRRGNNVNKDIFQQHRNHPFGYYCMNIQESNILFL